MQLNRWSFSHLYEGLFPRKSETVGNFMRAYIKTVELHPKLILYFPRWDDHFQELILYSYFVLDR